MLVSTGTLRRIAALTQYDRSIEDIGNVVCLEHVTRGFPFSSWRRCSMCLAGPDARPVPDDSIGDMWINIGRSQFHVPTGHPQVVRGHAGLVIPDRAALVRRLGNVRKPLEGTRFAFKGATITSRRRARGAIAFAATRLVRASARCGSACPMSNSTCRGGRRRHRQILRKVLNTMARAADDGEGATRAFRSAPART